MTDKEVGELWLAAKTAEKTWPSPEKLWLFKIVDPNKIPRQYLKIDEQKIGQIVRAMKGLIRRRGQRKNKNE